MTLHVFAKAFFENMTPKMTDLIHSYFLLNARLKCQTSQAFWCAVVSFVTQCESNYLV